MNSLFLTALLLCGFCIPSTTCKYSIPSFVKICKKSDPDLDNCIISTIRGMIPYLGNGIHQMKIIPLEPLKISNLVLNTGNNLEIILTDVELSDLLKFEFRYFHLDVKVPEITLDIKIPKVGVKGKYKMMGHLIIFDLHGEGNSTMIFTNVDAKMNIKGKRAVKKAKEYFDFNNADVGIKIEDSQTYFSNLIPGNKELTDQTNQILNQNSRTIVNEFEPAIGAAFKSVILQILKNVFDTFPVSKVLLD